jgi:hypothetical protein
MENYERTVKAGEILPSIWSRSLCSSVFRRTISSNLHGEVSHNSLGLEL